MTTPGCFVHIANQGKLDKLLLAPELLDKRINDIVCRKKNAGASEADALPTLVDIEKTHILFVNSHFKPHVGITNGYIKCFPQGEARKWDQATTFDVPHSGEFFSDPVLFTKFATASCKTSSLPSFPSDIGSSSGSAKDTDKGSISYTNTASSTTIYSYNYVDSNGNLLDRTATTHKNFVRYCEYPGERFLPKVEFQVNHNPIDVYKTNDLVMHRLFKIMPHKLDGWKKLMGQQVPIKGYTELTTVKDASGWPSEHTGIDSLASPANATDTSVKECMILNGPQTPKAQQPELKMMIPIMFWFSDIKSCIPSVSIPVGQRHINITTAKSSDILYPAPGDVKLRLTTEVISTSSSGGPVTTSYKTYITEYPVLIPDSTVIEPDIKELTLYINNYYVNAAIHDIYMKRVSFNLIRTRKQQETTVSEAKGSVKLNQLRLAVESIYFGFKPQKNTTNPTYKDNGIETSAGNKNVWRDWHRFTDLTDQYSYVKSFSQQPLLTVGTDPSDVDASNFYDNEVDYRAQCVSQSEKLVYPVSTDVVDKIKLETHGNELYQYFDKEFFNAYIPWQFGPCTIVSPEDTGVFSINWCIYPGSHQPSGHFNLTRAKDTYIHYESSHIATNDSYGNAIKADLIISACVINFTLTSDGSMVLRFGG